MAKNIVLLSDGTGNSAGKLFRTNVWRLYQALDLSRPEAGGRARADRVLRRRRRLILLHADGCCVGGAVGWGLKRNVIDLLHIPVSELRGK